MTQQIKDNQSKISYLEQQVNTLFDDIVDCCIALSCKRRTRTTKSKNGRTKYIMSCCHFLSCHLMSCHVTSCVHVLISILAAEQRKLHLKSQHAKSTTDCSEKCSS